MTPVLHTLFQITEEEGIFLISSIRPALLECSNQTSIRQKKYWLAHGATESLTRCCGCVKRCSHSGKRLHPHPLPDRSRVHALNCYTRHCFPTSGHQAGPWATRREEAGPSCVYVCDTHILTTTTIHINKFPGKRKGPHIFWAQACSQVVEANAHDSPVIDLNKQSR